MTGFGSGLREQRERRGLSLEMLSGQTKLSVRQLTSLEAEDFAALPGGVFRKGICRAYLSAAGLDESEWMPRFEASVHAHALATGAPPDAAQNPEAWAEFAENVRRSRPKLKTSHGLRWLGVLLMLLALAAAAWAAWHYILRTKLTL